MKGKTLLQFFRMTLLLAMMAAGCAPASVRAPETPEMKAVTLPGSEEIAFELPSDWEFVGNAGYLSPDGGKTLLSVHQAWMEEGRDAAQLLLSPEDEQTGANALKAGAVDVSRIDYTAYQSKPDDSEKKFLAYARIYAFPSADGAQMIGMLVRAETEAALEPLEAIALHAIETFSMTPVERPAAAAGLPEMQTLSVPGPEEITFELPVDWQDWGNGFAWSPDDGKTMMGLNRAWVEEGKDARKPLFPAEGELLNEMDLTVGERAVNWADFKVYQVNAAEGTKTFQGYEAVYTFLSPDGTVMLAVLFIAPSEEDLSTIEPVMLHAVESFSMK